MLCDIHPDRKLGVDDRKAMFECDKLFLLKKVLLHIFRNELVKNKIQ